MRIIGAERPAQDVAEALNTCVRWNTVARVLLLKEQHFLVVKYAMKIT